MESNETASGNSVYAYRPLTTKHRRAGSTGTTGDEEYTTDEDELYPDDTECSGASTQHPIMKSDLARAATDLFGYACKDRNDEPTSLFDEEDTKLPSDLLTKVTIHYPYTDKLSPASDCPIKSKYRSAIVVAENDATGMSYNLQEDDFKPREYLVPEEDDDSSKIVTSPSDLGLEDAKNSIRPGEKEIGCAEKPEEISVSEAGAGSGGVRRDSAVTKCQNGEKDDDDVATALSFFGEGNTVDKLCNDLRKAREELKLKNEEVERLSRFKRDVEQEVEELTASLFQEAHNMVKMANTRQASAERLLEESRMKAEVLAAEVIALKTLVLTSTPAKPNPHLHPRIDARLKSSNDREDGQRRGLFVSRSHRRRSPPSRFDLRYGRDGSPPDLSSMDESDSFYDDPRPVSEHERDREREKERDGERDYLKNGDEESRDFGVEIDPRVHAEFLRWKSNPCIDKGDSFIARVFHEDIDLSLDFPNIELGTKVRQAVLDGNIFIEAVGEKHKLSFPKKCALLEAPRHCRYRMRLSDQENHWYCISQICRNRIIAVCDFLNYLRYVERGLVKSSVPDIYWEITRLRKEIVKARLGLALPT